MKDEQSNHEHDDMLPIPDHSMQNPPDDLIVESEAKSGYIVRQSTKQLWVKFDDNDLEAIRDSLARQTMQISSLQEEKKAVTAEINRSIKTLHDRNETLAQDIINQGREMSVAVEITYNKPEVGKKTIVRKDTFESWEEDMDSSEHRLDNITPEVLAGVNDGSNDEDAEDPETTDPPPFGPDAVQDAQGTELEAYLEEVQAYRSEKYPEDPEKTFVGLDPAYFTDAMARGVSPGIAFEGYVIYLKEWQSTQLQMEILNKL